MYTLQYFFLYKQPGSYTTKFVSNVLGLNSCITELSFSITLNTVSLRFTFVSLELIHNNIRFTNNSQGLLTVCRINLQFVALLTVCRIYLQLSESTYSLQGFLTAFRIYLQFVGFSYRVQDLLTIYRIYLHFIGFTYKLQDLLTVCRVYLQFVGYTYSLQD